jgi:hypothetical protein
MSRQTRAQREAVRSLDLCYHFSLWFHELLESDASKQLLQHLDKLPGLRTLYSNHKRNHGDPKGGQVKIVINGNARSVSTASDFLIEDRNILPMAQTDVRKGLGKILLAWKPRAVISFYVVESQPGCVDHKYGGKSIENMGREWLHRLGVTVSSIW